MALQGTIDTFELTEVVRLLAAGGKTGVLRLEGSRGSGRVWVNGGKVTAIEVDHAPRTGGPAEAMFELLRFDDGHFTFAAGELADPEGAPTELEEILGDAEAQLAEWREVELLVPTTRAHVSLRPELERGDVVLVRTGWQERQGKVVSFDAEPGLNLEAALWLALREVAVIGADNFAVEQMPFPAGSVFPVHQRLIRDFGIPLLEGLVLQPLATSGRAEFLFAASPLPVVGGTGSPLSPMAIL